MPAERPSRPPRRGSPPAGRGGAGRPGPPRRDGGAARRQSDGPTWGDRRPGGRTGGGGRGPGRSSDGRPGGGGRRRDVPERPPTAAERRAAEVNATRSRLERDPEQLEAAERAKIEGRQLEEWIDEGGLRSEASEATSRAQARPARRPRTTHLSPEVAAEINGVVRDARRAAVLRERLGQAQDALDHERYDEARHVSTRLLKELPSVAAVHEVLGLAAYRSGRWKQAASELEAALELEPDVEVLPVLADAYRALRRWKDVERVWKEVRAASPAQEILAEARIVVAGAYADRGDLPSALETMSRVTQVPKRVREHHLRQWYVIADLHDRAGNTLEAARWFERIAATDRNFVDVVERLRSLGR